MSHLSHSYGMLIFASLIFSCAMTLTRSPYDIIGVDKYASQVQIKRAYKELARKLHPDKSNLSGTESESKFIELNKAFELLKDPEKRKRYDQFGDTDDTSSYQRRQSNMANYGQRGFRTFTFHNGHSTFEFKFDTSSNKEFKKNSISSRQYYQYYVPLSKRKVFYIFLYSDFCQPCNLIEPTWTKLSNELKKFGVGFLTLNVYQEPQLAREIGATSIPYIVSLVDEQVKHYHYKDISLSKLIEFTKSVMPSDLIVHLYDDSIQDRFIASGPQNNRLTALILNNDHSLKLRYLLIAFEFRDRYQFGHVSYRVAQHKLLKDRYKLHNDLNTILLFDEDYQDQPFQRLQTAENQDFHSDEIRELLLNRPHLQLPRITSQTMLEDLCVDLSDGTQIQRKLCVILLARNIPKDEVAKTMMRKFIKFQKFDQDKGLAFSYIDPSKQSDFISTLLEDKFTSSSPLYAMLVLRKIFHADNRIKYKMLKHKWDPTDMEDFDKAKLELMDTLSKFRRDNIDLPMSALLRPLVDEEEPSFLWRMKTKIVHSVERLYNWSTTSDSLHILMLTTLMIAMLTYYCVLRFFISYKEFEKSPSKSEERRQQDGSNNGCHPMNNNDGVRLIELKAETYNGLIRLSKPGCRSIILLCDSDSASTLLPLFTNIVRPYRRNKSLLFGHLRLEKNLSWYESLLSQAIRSSDMQINAKNCIGTVLSLNGFSKYFCVYHLKHIEPNPYEDEAGSFLGFDHVASPAYKNKSDHYYQGDSERVSFFSEFQSIETTSSSDETSPRKTGQTEDTVNNHQEDEQTDLNRLLDNLPIWLDKMFDGITRRYHIDYWPDNLR